MWWRDTIRFYTPDTFYSVSFFYDDHWELETLYGNLEAPFVRTSISIDTRDYALDLVATPKGEWQKDEAEFARRLEVGIDSAEHQARVRAAGEKLVSRLERGAFPFEQRWVEKVPKHLPIPRLPENWTRDYATHGVSVYAT